MAKELKHLDRLLKSINRRPTRAYQGIIGTYDYGDFNLIIDYVPQDSLKYRARMKAIVPLSLSSFPKDIFSTKIREIAARDFLVRSFAIQADKYSLTSPARTGGHIAIDTPGREVLETSAIVVGTELIEARFTVDLPTDRENVSGSRAIELFMKCIPKVIRSSLFYNTINTNSLTDWIETNEDADALRSMLKKRGLVGFIADGSIIIGQKQRKEKSKDINNATFKSPEELAVAFDLPNRGTVNGMGIPSGITIIVGGHSHGKSTLLSALELGVYNHIPGDGRELVVTVSDAVGIRTEEGRRIEQVDISPFFSRMPGGIDTRRFSTEYASVSVSQAANIMEALEIGTSLLLIDEDTSAAPLMGRDAQIQALIPKEEEPITPLIDILPVLRDDFNVSTVMIVNSSGDYFNCADTVIAMKDFTPVVYTRKAKQIARDYQTVHVRENKLHFSLEAGRCPLVHSLDPLKKKTPDIRLQNVNGYVQYGDEFIDLTRISQLVNRSQSRGISRGLALVYRIMGGARSLKEAVENVIKRVENIGLDTLSNRRMGDLAGFRAHELARAVNRLKRLRVK